MTRLDLPAFITLEGGEGAGKSTQVARLVARLEAFGVPAIASREPGGTVRAEEIRNLLLSGAVAPLGTAAEALLFAAARADHLDSKIRPALARGTSVVCDRFSDSTRAYQGALGDVPPALLLALEQVVVGETRPGLTFMLDLPTAVGLSRAKARHTGTPDRFEREDTAFHERLRAAFLQIAEGDPARCVVIDAAPDQDTVARDIWAATVERLGLPAGEVRQNGS